jgi:rhodanese-related sulfurtransferase
MNEATPPTPSPDHDRLRLSHVLTIIFVGAALGVGFNALQLSANPARALPWVKSERHVVTLEHLSDTPPPAGARSAPAADTTVAAVADTARKAAAPAPAPGAHAKPPAKPAKRLPAKAAPPASTPAAGAASAPAASSATPAPAADLPVIPDSREPIEVGLDVVQKFHAAGAALFLDARSADEYAEGHIAGAVDLPFDDVFKNPALAKAVDPKGRVIITYCSGGDCDLSRSLAFSLIDAGFRKVLVFTGGQPAWASAGKPVHKGAQP